MKHINYFINKVELDELDKRDAQLNLESKYYHFNKMYGIINEHRAAIFKITDSIIILSNKMSELIDENKRLKYQISVLNYDKKMKKSHPNL